MRFDDEEFTPEELATREKLWDAYGKGPLVFFQVVAETQGQDWVDALLDSALAPKDGEIVNLAIAGGTLADLAKQRGMRPGSLAKIAGKLASRIFVMRNRHKTASELRAHGKKPQDPPAVDAGFIGLIRAARRTHRSYETARAFVSEHGPSLRESSDIIIDATGRTYLSPTAVGKLAQYRAARTLPPQAP